jgi:hypothetical protein
MASGLRRSAHAWRFDAITQSILSSNWAVLEAVIELKPRAAGEPVRRVATRPLACIPFVSLRERSYGDPRSGEQVYMNREARRWSASSKEPLIYYLIPPTYARADSDGQADVEIRGPGSEVKA